MKKIRHLSETHKQAIRKARHKQKMMPRSEVTKQKIRQKLKGRKRPDLSGEKHHMYRKNILSIHRKDCNCSFCKTARYEKKGENHFNWKGGEYQRNDSWRIKKK